MTAVLVLVYGPACASLGALAATLGLVWRGWRPPDNRPYVK